jgi:predicted CXXCH cytochrome family protein
VKCHSGLAYIDYSENVTPARTSMQIHTCAVCHDPHSAANESQLRITGTATLPGNTQVPNVGSSATCMTCHNGRQVPADALNNGFPHYSTASENLMALSAITFGHTLQSSPHRAVSNPNTGQTKCVMCHMAATPGTPRDGVLDPGENLVGAHTFLLANDNGTPEDTGDDFSNVANACAVCHQGLTTFNRPANGDYDGDGTTEGVQDEVRGLLALVLAQLEASGVQHQDHYPYWSGVTTDLQRQAIYNHELVSHDGSFGVHNTAFSVGVLQITYRELTGSDVPNATLRYTP